MARDSVTEYFDVMADPALALTGDEDFELRDHARTRLLRSCINTIVFSAMGCEAAIYDLAAIHLTDKYATSVLDKLDLVAKWTIVPQLICGSALQPHGPSINALRTMVRARNRLVHHKSRPADLEPEKFPEFLKQAASESAALESDCVTSFQAVILLSLELNRVLRTFTGVMPSFQEHPSGYPDEKYSPDVLKLVHRCREIDAKNAAVPRRDIYSSWRAP